MVYINQDIDIDRKSYMENQINFYNANIKRFSAISSDFDNYCSDWREIIIDENTPKPFYNYPKLSKPEIGCLLSHLECIRIFGKKDLIVFEDDVDFSVCEYWDFTLFDLLKNIDNNIKILQMVKFFNYEPIEIKKLKVSHENGGNWGTAAYYIKKELSNKIVKDYYINEKWNISKIKCDWVRKTADAALYSFDDAYTCTIFSLRQGGDSTIHGEFNPSNTIGKDISDFLKNKKPNLKTILGKG
jgi:hypothetical protein